MFYILGDTPLYQVHNINKEEPVSECILCELDAEVTCKITVPMLVEGEFSYMMLCEKYHTKLIKRLKYKCFFNILSKLKRVFSKAQKG